MEVQQPLVAVIVISALEAPGFGAVNTFPETPLPENVVPGLSAVSNRVSPSHIPLDDEVILQAGVATTLNSPGEYNLPKTPQIVVCLTKEPVKSGSRPSD